MLIYRRTSIFDSTAQTLVNTVNCVGVMGKGIAKEFKSRYPEMFEVYKKICDEGLLEPGKLWLWKSEDHWVLNFPTKKHWKHPAKIEWIESGLQKFASAYEQQGIREVSFPRLGCGNGGLEWADVKPLMERYLGNLPISVFIHDFEHDIGIPEHLELLTNKLELEAAKHWTFDSFVNTLRRLVEISDGKLANLTSDSRIDVEFKSDDELLISSENQRWSFERDDLHGVWLRLHRGILTKDRASWAADGGGESLLSVLGLMPQIRAIEIQRAGEAEPEVALELKPNTRRTTVAQPTAQAEFAWH